MDLIQAIEVFAFVTGILYVFLEIGQKNLMWVVGILTGAACAWSFCVQHVWASMGLNIYYVGVSVWGLMNWKRDTEKLAPEDKGAIHLARLSRRSLIVSLGVFFAGTAALIPLLQHLGDSAPSLDAHVVMLSAIGTWWLARSYAEQWLVWIVADILSGALCFATGLHWMGALYIAYTLSAVWGWFHWKKNGKYIS